MIPNALMRLLSARAALKNTLLEAVGASLLPTTSVIGEKVLDKADNISMHINHSRKEAVWKRSVSREGRVVTGPPADGASRSRENLERAEPLSRERN
ncbi:hypothetical protein BSZ25_13765 [Bradyrhizobium canariense]|nr:hypothetical protein BSZ24_17920 [Bradyrhizobium canariense]OSI91842.1 hypothetical protein BSZ25_13765 [Bradyrhizobium canariense]